MCVGGQNMLPANHAQDEHVGDSIIMSESMSQMHQTSPRAHRLVTTLDSQPWAFAASLVWVRYCILQLGSCMVTSKEVPLAWLGESKTKAHLRPVVRAASQESTLLSVSVSQRHVTCDAQSQFATRT